MTKINDGGPSFPSDELTHGGKLWCQHSGMTLRDYFAAKAMQAIVASSDWSDLHALSRLAYRHADAMIAVREQVK